MPVWLDLLSVCRELRLTAVTIPAMRRRSSEMFFSFSPPREVGDGPALLQAHGCTASAVRSRPGGAAAAYTAAGRPEAATRPASRRQAEPGRTGRRGQAGPWPT